jgi:hypothetical protein
MAGSLAPIRPTFVDRTGRCAPKKSKRGAKRSVDNDLPCLQLPGALATSPGPSIAGNDRCESMATVVATPARPKVIEMSWWPCTRARSGWLLVAALAGGCGDEASSVEPRPAPTPPSDPAMPGKVEPAPASELAFGRAVLEALQRDDWDGYTNLLATRADMMGIYAHEDHGESRERRKRRRMVWRRVNRLRDSEAEEGWKSTRSGATREGIAWDALRLVDVRRETVADDGLPEQAAAARLELVLEHQGVERVLALGTCVRAPRGWVALYPMQWQQDRNRPPRGESLLGRVGDHVAAPDR